MTTNHDLCVTTGNKEKPEYVRLAHEYAAELGVSYVQRRDRSLAQLRAEYGVDPFLVIAERVKLYVGDAEFFFHPSMANTRIKRLKSGDNDIVIARTGARPGDIVLDCTLGLGADSIVFAHVVGEEGRVIGIESSPVISAIVRRGLQEVTVDTKAVNAAMRRVEVICADHLEYMRSLPDRSVDIVYFDPMFRRTVEESAAIEPLRLIGNDQALSVEAVQEATRVARRRVVLKERWYSKEFERLGFHIPRRSTGSTNYGVIEIGGTEQ